jgi:hypothetical protein
VHHKIPLPDRSTSHPQNAIGCGEVKVEIGHQKIIHIG